MRFPALLLLLLSASAALAQTAFRSDFENAHPTWSWYTHTVDGGGIRIGELTTQFSRVGAGSARFIMDRSQGGYFHRAMFRKTDGFATDRDEKWIGFSTYFPASGPDAWVYDSLPELIFQLHNDPNASPILGLYCEAGKLGVEYRWASVDPGSNKDVSMAAVDVGPQEPGRWVDWVFHVKLAPIGTGGALEVWKTDSKGAVKKVVDLKGIRFGYPNGTAPAIDIGLYKWPWKAETYNGKRSDVDRRVVYFDEFRLMGPDGSLQTVSVPAQAGLGRPRAAGVRFQSPGRPVDMLGRALLPFMPAIPFVPASPSP